RKFLAPAGLRQGIASGSVQFETTRRAPPKHGFSAPDARGASGSVGPAGAARCSMYRFVASVLAVVAGDRADVSGFRCRSTGIPTRQGSGTHTEEDPP